MTQECKPECWLQCGWVANSWPGIYHHLCSTCILLPTVWYLARRTVGCCPNQQTSFRWADRTPAPLFFWLHYCSPCCNWGMQGSSKWQISPSCCAPSMGAIPWHHSLGKSLWRRGEHPQHFAHASPNSRAGSSKLDLWYPLLHLRKGTQWHLTRDHFQFHMVFSSLCLWAYMLTNATVLQPCLQYIFL